MARKSFNEKLKDSRDMPKIIELTDERSIAMYGGSRMLIAAPLEYDGLIRKVPAGKLTTSEKLRKHLADSHGADFTCPLTAGIFINIAALASAERETDHTPYWRVLKKDGELNEKFPGGVEDQRARLEAEGHEVAVKGKRMFVKDYEKNLLDLKNAK